MALILQNSTGVAPAELQRLLAASAAAGQLTEVGARSPAVLAAARLPLVTWLPRAAELVTGRRRHHTWPPPLSCPPPSLPPLRPPAGPRQRLRLPAGQQQPQPAAAGQRARPHLRVPCLAGPHRRRRLWPLHLHRGPQPGTRGRGAAAAVRRCVGGRVGGSAAVSDGCKRPASACSCAATPVPPTPAETCTARPTSVHADASRGSLQPSSLRFGLDSWSRPQAVTLTGGRSQGGGVPVQPLPAPGRQPAAPPPRCSRRPPPPRTAFWWPPLFAPIVTLARIPLLRASLRARLTCLEVHAPPAPQSRCLQARPAPPWPSRSQRPQQTACLWPAR